ncbi:hypothetical protein S40288_10148, partial [Stachybotrys chartarum IBT 40288]
IAGLTAAIGFRLQGHEVTLFERSTTAQETAAAIHLAPNCYGLLRRFGIDPETFGANPVHSIVEYDALGNLKLDVTLTKALSIWEHPWALAHRARLHDALKKAALDKSGPGSPAVLKTSSRVINVDCSNASIQLSDGSWHFGDLVLGADGVSSLTRAAVVGTDIKPFSSGKSAFRFLVSYDKIRSNSQTERFVKREGCMTLWIGDDRRLVMYPCENNTIMNFVGIHPSELSLSTNHDGWNSGGSKQVLLDVYRDFGPIVASLLGLVDEKDLKVWTLLDMAQLPTWVNGKAALLGGIAIEDAASLSALLRRGTRKEDIPDRLALYESIRRDRAHKVQEYTRIAGTDLNDENRENFNIMEFMNYNFGHDEWHNSTHALNKVIWSQDPHSYWSSPISFGPVVVPSEGQPTQPVDAKSLTYTARFKASAAYLKTLFPTEAFRFARPGTVGEISFNFTEVEASTGSGCKRSSLGLSLHGVEYQKVGGSKVVGSFLVVLFESSDYPQSSSPVELGLPKVYCNIQAVKNDKALNVTCSSAGKTFLELNYEGLEPIGETNIVSGEASIECIKPGPSGPPKPLVEEGTLWYRSVPTVGGSGKADAAYPVFAASVSPGTPEKPQYVETGTGCDIKFLPADWEGFSVIRHIAKGLAEISLYEAVRVTVEKVDGNQDYRTALKIE